MSDALMKLQADQLPSCMPIAGKVIKERNLSLLEAVSRLHVNLKPAILYTRDLQLWHVLSFCSIIVNFMPSCNGTDGRLNFQKWVWRCSSSLPPSMSPNILSMSALTYKTCLCLFMEKMNVGTDVFFILVQLLLPSFFLLSPLFFLSITNCCLISAAPGDAAV